MINTYFNIIMHCVDLPDFSLKLLGIFSNNSSYPVKMPVKVNSCGLDPALPCYSISERPGRVAVFLETIVIRFMFRLLAYIALSLAIIAAVLDAARSVGASQLTMTSLQESWQSISASSLALAETSIKTHIYPILWDPLMLWILEAPTFVIFALLAFLFYAMGYKRENRAGRFAAR